MNYNKSSAPPMEWGTTQPTNPSHTQPYPGQSYVNQQPIELPPSYSSVQGYGQPQYTGMGHESPPYPMGRQNAGLPQYTGMRYESPPYPMGQQNEGLPRIITIQPPTLRSPANPPAKDYACYSLFTLFFCCLPLGIFALVKSMRTQEANESGDCAAAAHNSRHALSLNNTALAIGVMTYLVSLICFIVFFVVLN